MRLQNREIEAALRLRNLRVATLAAAFGLRVDFLRAALDGEVEASARLRADLRAVLGADVCDGGQCS